MMRQPVNKKNKKLVYPKYRVRSFDFQYEK